MGDSNENSDKVRVEFLRLLEYYLRKIEYSEKIRPKAVPRLQGILQLLEQHKQQISGSETTTIKSSVDRIRSALTSEEGAIWSAIRRDFLEELDLFWIRHNLEEKE